MFRGSTSSDLPTDPGSRAPKRVPITSHGQLRASTGGEIQVQRRNDETIPQVEPDLEIAPDSIIGHNVGRYHVLGVHLTFGAIHIYAAVDTVAGRRVALRVLRRRRFPNVRSLNASSGGQTQGLREILALARITHRHLSTVLDTGIAGHTLYWAMELTPGQALSDYLATQHLSGPEIVTLLAPLAGALAALHDAGYFCGILTLDHISVRADRHASLWTLGSASRRELEFRPDDNTDRTDPESFVAHWIAPELRPGGLPNARSDVYAFCALLFQALFGEQPQHHEDGNGELFIGIPSHCRNQVVPLELIEILRQGLAIRPADRTSTAFDLARELEALHWPTRHFTLRQVATTFLPFVAAAALLPLFPSEQEPRAARTADERRESSVALLALHERLVAAHSTPHAAGEKWAEHIVGDPNSTPTLLAHLRHEATLSALHASLGHDDWRHFQALLQLSLTDGYLRHDLAAMREYTNAARAVWERLNLASASQESGRLQPWQVHDRRTAQAVLDELERLYRRAAHAGLSSEGTEHVVYSRGARPSQG